MPVSDFTPSVSEVGAELLSRTKDQYGNETGTFSGTTTPTDTQVEALISKAADRVSLKIGTEVPAALRQDAKDIVALRAAMMVEQTLFADQITSNRSPYPVLLERYKAELADLQLAIQIAEDGDGTFPNQPSNGPSYSFPEATPWLTRRM